MSDGQIMAGTPFRATLMFDGGFHHGINGRAGRDVGKRVVWILR